MNKIVKRKLIGAVLCLLIGIIIYMCPALFYERIGEDLHSYMSGFSGGIIGVGLYSLVVSIRALRNPDKGKELENNNQDERLIFISDKSMAITFRICLILESLASLGGALMQNMEIARYLGFAICIQLIVYLIVRFSLSLRN